MPLKASIGLSRKVGQENYGSLGANCQLEVELDASLIGDAEAFREKIQRLYALANQALVDQLAQQSTASPSNVQNGNGHSKPNSNGNGHSKPRNGNGSNEKPDESDDPPASNKQIKYLLDIARQRHRMDLAQTAEYCQESVGTSDIYKLSKNQASVVIDQLSGKNGNGRR